MKKITLTLAFALIQFKHNAIAHEGHALDGTHWHATDAMGFMLAAALVAVAVYFGKK